MIGASVAVPAVGYVTAPLRRGDQGAGEMVDLGPLTAVAMGQWVLLPLDLVQQDGWEQVRQRHSVWVRRTGTEASEVAVLSPICPHLGCPINRAEGESGFRCPCHGGTFDADGRYVSGPPPRSMDALPFEIRDGHLLVRWTDYKIGVAERVPVQL